MVTVSLFSRQSARLGLAASFAFFFALAVRSTNADHGGRFGSIPMVGNTAIVLYSRTRSRPDSMSQGPQEFLGGQCRVTLTDEGKLTTEKKMSSGLYEEAWSSGRSYLGKHQDGQYVAELRGDGVLELRLEQTGGSDTLIFYESVRQVDTDHAVHDFYSKYVLLIDEDCVLRIYGWYFAGSRGDQMREVWSNIRSAMTEGDVMLQGDIIRGMNDNGEETHMRLQHDCNLVQRYGKDKANSSHKIWASGSDKSSDPEDVTCWVLVDNAKVRVCVGEFDVNNRQNCNDAEIRYSTPTAQWDVVELGNKGFKDATR
jgi:hypothetical protein